MRRSSPALFEVLGGGTVGRRTPPSPSASAPVAPIPPPPRASAPIEVVAPEPVPGSPATPEDPWGYESARPRRFDLQRKFSISASVVLLAAAGVIALCVLAWSTAYEAGKREARAETARELRLQSSGALRDPLNSDLPLNPGLVQQGQSPSAAGAAPTLPPPAPQPRAGDPREPGKNYLQLITTDRAEAEGIVKFLGENGVPAFVVPVGVDRTGSAAKNPARFTVLAARGITPEEYRARAASRTELEGAISRLGRRWRDEKKGSTDFSGKFWSKFSG